MRRKKDLLSSIHMLDNRFYDSTGEPYVPKGKPKTKRGTVPVAITRDANEYKFPEMFYIVQNLIEVYGNESTLDEIICKFRPLGFKCPQCNGSGKIQEKYDAYPAGMPDSGCVHDWQYRDVECSLCNGSGALEKKMKPHMVQDGWEEA